MLEQLCILKRNLFYWRD